METDKSYVFFREAAIDDPALGAQGSLGANITPLASIAVDRALPCAGRAVLCRRGWPRPGARPDDGAGYRRRHQGRGARRYLLWPGADAENRAGSMKAHGTLFVLLPNAVADRIGYGRDYAVP